MAMLILQDGTVIRAESFGAEGECEGELVFNTSMTGYQEIITDPSYAKQIVIMTYPEIGNYGINDFDFESEKSYVSGFIVKECCGKESHYKSKESIETYLEEKGIVALKGIDTRSLVKKIRQKGAMSAYITSSNLDSEKVNKAIEKIQYFKIDEDIIEEVSCKSKYMFNPKGKINVALIDYGVKKGIINSLAKRNCRITVFPCDTEANTILENDFDAVFLSNGPGNPADYKFQIMQIRHMMGKIPMFGICLGYQLLAIVAGAETFKLKYGHRGANHPVINLENNKVLITSQNHGYAVDTKTVTKSMRLTYKNLNDDTLEGFEIPSLGIYAVQFHPEAHPGPDDASVIFDEWINIIEKDIKRINEVKNEE